MNSMAALIAVTATMGCGTVLSRCKLHWRDCELMTEKAMPAQEEPG